MSDQSISNLIKIQQLKGLEIEKRKSQKKDNQDEILKTILQFEPKGISTKEIENKTGLNHDTVCIHCKYLASRGLITKINKKGMYHLTDKASGDRNVRAWKFKNRLMEVIHSSDIHFDKENEFSNITESDFTKENYDRIILFSFANRIGALISYVMIEALKPGAFVPRIRGKKMTVDLGTRKMDSWILEWIKNVIDPIDLFREFLKLSIVRSGQPINTPRFTNLTRLKNQMSSEATRKFNDDPEYRKKVMNYIAQHNKEQREIRRFEPSDIKKSFYEMDKINFENLVNVFREVYPAHHNKLEAIRRDLR
jgi:DNA-binding transcriptional regulator YhcF (GntR family)